MNFPSLTDASIEDASVAAHHVLQLLRGQWVSDASDPLGVKGDDSLTAKQVEVIGALVGDIEQHSRTSLANLRFPNVNPYSKSISSELELITRKQLHVDETRGERLLYSLRLAR